MDGKDGKHGKHGKDGKHAKDGRGQDVAKHHPRIFLTL